MVVLPHSKIEILKYLIENRELDLSIKKLSQEIKIDYKDCYNAVKNLEKENIIKFKKIGKSLICVLTYEFSPLVNFVEYSRCQKLMENRFFKSLIQDLNLIKKPFICLLFGSYVKGGVTKNSDIDLLFLTDEEKEIEKVIRRYPQEIHTTYINYKDFISMANSKEFSVVSEVLKKNIILVGIEEFYRVMRNVR